MRPEPKRGEVWRVDLDPTRGDEIRKVRPVIVIGSDAVGRLNLRVIVPVTDWKEHYVSNPWMTRLDADAENGLVKTSGADAFQIRSLSTERFQSRLGTLPDEIVNAIAEAVALVIDYQTPASPATGAEERQP